MANERESEAAREWAEVLAFLKTRFPVFHESNVFFRDIQYGLQLWLQERGRPVSYPEAEQTAREFVSRLEREKVFVPVAPLTWTVNYPAFKTPVVKAPGPAKPAPATQAGGEAGGKTPPPGRQGPVPPAARPGQEGELPPGAGPAGPQK